jgi:elongation factor G
VDDGTSAFDVEPEEQRRKSSIMASLHHAAWRKHELNIIDTPGYSAFLHDTRNCLRAATGAVLVLGSTGGEIKIETEKVWAWCEELGLPLGS